MNTVIEAQRPKSQVAQRNPLAKWARKNALQLGTIGVALFIWLVFVIGAPRTLPGSHGDRSTGCPSCRGHHAPTDGTRRGARGAGH